METWSPDRAHMQEGFNVRFEWGLVGASAIAHGADIAVVVDVLSFTTTLSVALDCGMDVLPYRWKDDSATTYAADHNAVLAVRRDVASESDVTLSPQSIRAARDVHRLVLPSPNGSAISWHLATVSPVVLGASLRNADAVAAWLTDRYDVASATVAVIAAGEHWGEGALRPAIEDLWGSGAVLSAMHHRGWAGLSPEAHVARRAYEAIADGIDVQLRECASGQELIDNGYAADVDVAAEVDTSRSVPHLRGNRFISVS